MKFLVLVGGCIHQYAFQAACFLSRARRNEASKDRLLKSKTLVLLML